MYETYNPYTAYAQPNFITKQVTNIEEARNFIINPFNTYVFINYSANQIYLKKMNNNGLSDFIVYSMKQEDKPIDPLEDIKTRLTNLENKIGGMNNGNNTGCIYETEDASRKSDVVQQGSRNDERQKRN